MSSRGASPAGGALWEDTPVDLWQCQEGTMMSQCLHVLRNWFDLVSPEMQGNGSLIAGPRVPQFKPAGWLDGSLRHTLRPVQERGGLASSPGLSRTPRSPAGLPP